MPRFRRKLIDVVRDVLEIGPLHEIQIPYLKDALIRLQNREELTSDQKIIIAANKELLICQRNREIGIKRRMKKQ